MMLIYCPVGQYLNNPHRRTERSELGKVSSGKSAKPVPRIANLCQHS